MIRRSSVLALCCFALTGCPVKKEFKERHFFLMGTFVNVTLPAECESEFEKVSKLMAYLADEVASDSAKLSESDGSVKVGPFTCRLLRDAELYYSDSEGRFNPGIFTLTSLYGFPEGPYYVPSAENIEKALELAKRRVSVTESGNGCFADAMGMKIDLGAFAKGAIADEAAAYLRSRGINNFIVNGGGDLYASGSKNGVKWRLGITDPDDRNGFIDVIELEDKALATSGTYERYFTDANGRRISHLFDGLTGVAADKYASLSVIAEKAEDADAFSTIYFFMDEDEIADKCEKLHTPVMLVTAAGERKTFCGWPGAPGISSQ